ncbi:hypothetical protein ACHAXS_012930 [Conticribra weissflogii]
MFQDNKADSVLHNLMLIRQLEVTMQGRPIVCCHHQFRSRLQLKLSRFLAILEEHNTMVLYKPNEFGYKCKHRKQKNAKIQQDPKH